MWESIVLPLGLPLVTQSQVIAMKTSRIIVGERKVTFRLTSTSLSQIKICGTNGAQGEASMNCSLKMSLCKGP